jgi:uncharacterized protein (TIGR02246 family)
MESDEQQIRQLIATWMTATKSGDSEKVLSLIADDVVFLIPGQPPMRSKSAFAAAQSALQQVDIDGQSEIQEIRVLGDWAYLWTKLSVTITPKPSGTPIKRSGNTLSILKKQSGKWLLYRDANLLAAESK